MRLVVKIRCTVYKIIFGVSNLVIRECRREVICEGQVGAQRYTMDGNIARLDFGACCTGTVWLVMYMLLNNTLIGVHNMHCTPIKLFCWSMTPFILSQHMITHTRVSGGQN